MRNARENWKCELQRIRKLQWWNDVKGKAEGFPDNPVVYHIHPIALVGNFQSMETNIDKLIREIGDIIAFGEGGYESYNTGTDPITARVVYTIRNASVGTITGRSINEILSSSSLPASNRNRLFATGKYQTIPSTLREGKSILGLTGEEKYDAIMQERFFKDYLFNKAGNGKLANFVKNNQGGVDDAQLAAAKEWASIAVPTGRPISNGTVSDGTMSYYQGKANSANRDSTAQLRRILQQLATSRG
jgi:hypothetical protein